ncbi:MAG: alcohol dehydrogenase catalytic domain-containing protein [Chloroflexi bacterium]|nr:alcohol dehydrogenase catalytic domain-containing protein [Chloroflexota bacterium]
MLAIVYDGQLRQVDDYPRPALRAGEALIRPSLVGICNTDIEITRGYMGHHGVLGHEFVGTVVACEDAWWVGQRVVGEINAACRSCAVCARGDESHCPNRTTLGIDRRDGVMAELFSLPVACLHAVPDRMPDAVAVFTEPVAAAFEILQQLHIYPTDRVAVVGDGKLGLLCAQVLRLPGCDVTVIGRHPERWEFLGDLAIATVHGHDLDEAHLAPFDVVVECSGHPSGLATARRLVRPRGCLVMKSTFAAESALDMTMLVVDEIRLIGSRCGPFAAALRALDGGLVATAPLIAARFSLRDGLRAFAAATGRLKVVLEV